MPHSLYNRCLAWREDDFPEADVEALWSTADSPRRKPPAQELTAFVFRSCKPIWNERTRRDEENPAAEGARRLVSRAKVRYGAILSEWDWILLDAAEAILLRQTGGLDL